MQRDLLHSGWEEKIFEGEGLSRPILVEEFDPEGNLLRSTKKRYNAFHLIEEEGPEGEITHYTYDGAGRLIATKKEAELTTDSYDFLDRLLETREYVGENDFIAYKKGYDFLDRIVEESIEDSNGEIQEQIQYQYDSDSNRIAVIRHNQAGTSITRTRIIAQMT